MAQPKALAGAITEMPCSGVAEMFTRSSKMHLGSILVNSAGCHNNYVKTLKNALTVPNNDRGRVDY